MIGAGGGVFLGFANLEPRCGVTHTAAGRFPELDSAAFGGVLVDSGTRIADSLDFSSRSSASVTVFGYLCV